MVYNFRSAVICLTRYYSFSDLFSLFCEDFVNLACIVLMQYTWNYLPNIVTAADSQGQLY